MVKNNERELINKQTNQKGMKGALRITNPYDSKIRPARDNKPR